ncbi:hypothetical protein [Halorhabdus salina]|uniref:hypothetical protein n=1 Tax=Halorhabdus salina TaxID=2750670 RepID=UPI0015EFA2A6|nr:hypothetical protein [Halorhabdus salina]
MSQSLQPTDGPSTDPTAIGFGGLTDTVDAGTVSLTAETAAWRAISFARDALGIGRSQYCNTRRKERRRRHAEPLGTNAFDAIFE